jgi:hypothetical protein
MRYNTVRRKLQLLIQLHHLLATLQQLLDTFRAEVTPIAQVLVIALSLCKLVSNVWFRAHLAATSNPIHTLQLVPPRFIGLGLGNGDLFARGNVASRSQHFDIYFRVVMVAAVPYALMIDT